MTGDDFHDRWAVGLTVACLRIVVLVSTLALGAPSQAQSPPSTQASDPRAMGWMQGFPPPADKTIRFTDPDYFSFPKLRWTVCHFRELMPTAGVDRGPGAASALPQAPEPGIDALRFTPLGGQASMSWGEAFDANHTDGLLVLHHGRVVYERYAGCLGPHTLHGAMSLTKSITGLLGEVLVAEGALDENARVGTLIPQLQDSAFGDASVRQVLDMTTTLQFSEDYADPNAEVWQHAQAGSTLPPPAGYTGPRSYYESLQQIRKSGEHGQVFGYKTPNADALGWLLARTTGKPLNELLAERIWRRIGAEREAFYTVDAIGTPFAGGGFNVTLRDLARLGQLILQQGEWQGVQLLPSAAIERIQRGGERAPFARAGYAQLPGWSYRAMWWHSGDAHGAFSARGVHGQTLWIDPVADVVIARLASHPVAANAANDPTSLPAWRAVTKHLMAQDQTPLLGGQWVIEDVAGAGVIDRTRAFLRFLADGRLVGHATCNGLRGHHTSGARGRLRLRLTGITRKRCAPALMHQEERLLALLPRVTRYRIDDSGALWLYTAAGKTLTARR